MAKKKLSKKKRRRRLIRRLDTYYIILLAFVSNTCNIFTKDSKELYKLAQEAKELVNDSSLDTFMASGTTANI